MAPYISLTVIVNTTKDRVIISSNGADGKSDAIDPTRVRICLLAKYFLPFHNFKSHQKSIYFH